MPSLPIAFRWNTDREIMVPVPRFLKECHREFTDGTAYLLVAHEHRSEKSHKHYFSALREAWINLPEEIADQFINEIHFRKYALIKAGFYHCESIVLSSSEDALKAAAFSRSLDPYSIVTVNGCVVMRYTALSQSQKSMGKKNFQESKEKVLEIVSAMVGVTQKQLEESDPA